MKMLNVLSELEIELIKEKIDFSIGMEESLALWVIGRPAAGKTTIAMILHDIIQRAGHRIELIDGDVMRSALDGHLGYSMEDRLAVFKKYIHINQLLQRKGIIPITATIGGFYQFRELVRISLENPRFIYLDCPFDVAVQRDPKGLYAKALAGHVNNFFGLDIPYEKPMSCEMTIDSGYQKPSEIISKIINHLNKSGLLRKRIKLEAKV